jgi:hypothetical protein
MSYILPILAMLLFCWGIAALCKKLPKKLQLNLIIILSLSLTLLHWLIANTQLATIGFAARNRTPNHIAQDIGFFLVILGLLNIILVFKNIRIATIILSLLFVLLPVMWLLSW